MIHKIVFSSVLAVFCFGCVGKSKPPTPEEMNATMNAQTLSALQADREAFEAAAHGDASDEIQARLRKCGVLVVTKENGCVVFRWPFTHVLDSIPIIFFAPNGPDDLPVGFLKTPSSYHYPMAVDKNWFVARSP